MIVFTLFYLPTVRLSSNFAKKDSAKHGRVSFSTCDAFHSRAEGVYHRRSLHHARGAHHLKNLFCLSDKRGFLHGAPGGNRTHSLRRRRATLYPIALRMRSVAYYITSRGNTQPLFTLFFVLFCKILAGRDNARPQNFIDLRLRLWYDEEKHLTRVLWQRRKQSW